MFGLVSSDSSLVGRILRIPYRMMADNARQSVVAPPILQNVPQNVQGKHEHCHLGMATWTSSYDKEKVMPAGRRRKSLKRSELLRGMEEALCVYVTMPCVLVLPLM